MKAPGVGGKRLPVKPPGLFQPALLVQTGQPDRKGFARSWQGSIRGP